MNHLVRLPCHLLRRHEQSLKIKRHQTKMQLASILRHASLRKMHRKRHSREVNAPETILPAPSQVKMRLGFEKETSAMSNQDGVIGLSIRSLCESQLVYGLHDSKQS